MLNPTIDVLPFLIVTFLKALILLEAFPPLTEIQCRLVLLHRHPFFLYFLLYPILYKIYRYYSTIISLQTTDINTLKSIIEKLSTIRWNVHKNAPFSGPAQILEYLGRYTHKTAIAAHRIKELTGTTITFSYKYYADEKKKKLMTLRHQEFAIRFEQHILPKRFVKIRHNGYNVGCCFSSTRRKAK